MYFDFYCNIPIEYIAVLKIYLITFIACTFHCKNDLVLLFILMSNVHLENLKNIPSIFFVLKKKRKKKKLVKSLLTSKNI